MSKPTEEEVAQLVSAFQKLHTWPKADSAEDLVTWMSEYVHAKQDGSGMPPSAAGVTFPTSITLSQPPKLPLFSGDKQLDTTFDVWKYHYNCLLNDKSVSSGVLLKAVQQSLRGKAATAAICLGPDCNVAQLVSKLGDMFGSVDRGQSLFSIFYSAHQKENEDVTSWACRLEEILNRASAQSNVSPEVKDEMLRNQLWSGLGTDLRDKSAYIFDQGGSFGELLRALRRMETDMLERQPKKSSVVSKGAIHTGDTEINEVKCLLKQLTADVADLKKFKSESANPPRIQQDSHSKYRLQQQPHRRDPRIPQQHSEQMKGRFQSRNEPVCFRCGQVGHLQYGCRVRLDHSRQHALNKVQSMGRGYP